MPHRTLAANGSVLVNGQPPGPPVNVDLPEAGTSVQFPPGTPPEEIENELAVASAFSKPTSPLAGILEAFNAVANRPRNTLPGFSGGDVRGLTSEQVLGVAEVIQRSKESQVQQGQFNQAQAEKQKARTLAEIEREKQRAHDINLLEIRQKNQERVDKFRSNLRAEEARKKSERDEEEIRTRPIFKIEGGNLLQADPVTGEIKVTDLRLGEGERLVEDIQFNEKILSATGQVAVITHDEKTGKETIRMMDVSGFTAPPPEPEDPPDVPSPSELATTSRLARQQVLPFALEVLQKRLAAQNPTDAEAIAFQESITDPVNRQVIWERVISQLEPAEQDIVQQMLVDAETEIRAGRTPTVGVPLTTPRPPTRAQVKPDQLTDDKLLKIP